LSPSKSSFGGAGVSESQTTAATIAQPTASQGARRIGAS
jgi:hypothetical protein